MSAVPDHPIVVKANSTSGQLMVAFRTLLASAAGWAVGKGYIDGGVAAALVNVVIILVPLMWAQMVAKQKHDVLKQLASAAPDNMAVVK